MTKKQNDAEAMQLLVRELLQRPIAYHRALASIGGGALAGLFLSQAWYWSGRTDDADGWFYKTRDEWTEETGLTRDEQETARKRLRSRQLLEEKRAGVPARLYFRVRVDALIEALTQSKLQLAEMHPTRRREVRSPVGGNAPNKSVGKHPTINTETTQRLPETTHTQAGVRAGSSYSLAICRRYAHYLTRQGMQGHPVNENPEAYASDIFQSGRADGFIERWLSDAAAKGSKTKFTAKLKARGKQSTSPVQWRSRFTFDEALRYAVHLRATNRHYVNNSADTLAQRFLESGKRDAEIEAFLIAEHKPAASGDRSATSRFTLAQCRQYAESLRGDGITNPAGYAKTIFRSGEDDAEIEKFLVAGATASGNGKGKRVDASACPDCGGQGFYYPAGHNKGVKMCTHPRLKSQRGSASAGA
jgi:hypothetical protein